LPNEFEATLAGQFAERLLAAEPSNRRSAGFWENPGICCGSAGLGVYFLGEYNTSADPRYLAEAQRIAADLKKRATVFRDAQGRIQCSWSSAEHRVRPDFRQTQTGLMQGAAGIGLFLLQLGAVERNNDRFDLFEDLLH
jgi:lantibiotic modifying enzyme